MKIQKKAKNFQKNCEKNSKLVLKKSKISPAKSQSQQGTHVRGLIFHFNSCHQNEPVFVSWGVNFGRLGKCFVKLSK